MSDGTTAKRDFFISYNHRDKSWAEWIAWELREAGYTFNFAEWELPAGQSIAGFMQEATIGCDRVLCVVSPNYFASNFTHAEWEAFFMNDPRGCSGLVLPVRIVDCEIEGMLKRLKYIDLADHSETEARDSLLTGLNSPKPPVEPPDFPRTKSGTRTEPEIGPSRPAFPTATSRVFAVPHLRNPDFTGRESYLTNLRSNLESGAATALTHAISGLGGVGKTQLAIEYAYRYAPKYDAVLWVRAEEPIELSGDYALLAKKLNLPEIATKKQQVQIDAVGDWLDTHGDWLLIFDDATEPEAIRAYLPRSHAGHVLITSRHRDWTGTAHVEEVAVMEEAEAVELVVKESGSEDSDAAAKLAIKLGYLPLALSQAAAYIRRTNTGIPAYLELFDKRRGDLWKREKEPVDYPATVGTTWSLAFEQLEQESPHAVTLLNCCAFLAPDDIPRFLFDQSNTDLEGPVAELAKDALVLNDAIIALGYYSLIDVTPKTFSIHRLVQAVVRDRMDETTKGELPAIVARLVEGAAPQPVQYNYEEWPRLEELIAHGVAVIEHAQTTAPFEAANVALWCGSYRQVRAEFEEACSLIEKAIALFTRASGKNHPNVALAENNLGNVYLDLADTGRAKACFVRALHIYKNKYKPADSEYRMVALTLNNLGEALREERDYVGAKVHYEEALRIDESIFGPDHLRVATRVSNLGLANRGLGDIAGAKACFSRALHIHEDRCKPNDYRIAISLSTLGGVFSAEGDYIGAQDCYERALAISKENYESDHPNVASALYNLGFVFNAQGKSVRAKECYERALGTFERFLGEDHPSTRTVRRNLELLSEG